MIKNLFKNEEIARSLYKEFEKFYCGICDKFNSCPQKVTEDSECFTQFCKQAGAIRKNPLEEAREKTDEKISYMRGHIIHREDIIDIERAMKSERQIVDAMIKETE